MKNLSTDGKSGAGSRFPAPPRGRNSPKLYIESIQVLQNYMQTDEKSDVQIKKY